MTPPGDDNGTATTTGGDAPVSSPAPGTTEGSSDGQSSGLFDVLGQFLADLL
jgi:hypothetical protein